MSGFLFRVPARSLVASLFVLALAACSGGGGRGDGSTADDDGLRSPAPDVVQQGGASGQPSPDKAAEQDAGVVSLHRQRVNFASMVRLPLKKLNLPQGLQADQLRVLKGGEYIEDLVLIDGEIRFITLDDPGASKELILEVRPDGKPQQIPVTLATEFPTAIQEDLYITGERHEPTPLQISGLGPRNSLQPRELVIRVDRDVRLDENISIGLIQTGDSFIALQDYWTLLPEKNGFVIPAENTKRILDELASAEYSVNLNFNTRDSTFVKEWWLNVYKPVASVSGQLVNRNDGKAETSLNGRRVAIRGTGGNNTRWLATVDEAGRFRFDDLASGTYFIELLDVRTPGMTATPLVVKPEPSAYDLKLPVWRPSVTAGQGKTMQAKKSIMEQGTIVGDDACAKMAMENGEAVRYWVWTTDADRTNHCEVKHTIRQGQERVSVRISVSSEEFPEWTSKRSPFNDTWHYSVYGLPGVEANKGQVNDSHQAKQTITKEYCVDTSKLAEQGPHTFEATLEARNVGDDDFPTFVSLIVRNRCDDLRVTSAEFSTTNPKGHRILQPVKEGDGKKGNLPGSFISIPLGESLDGWGPRLTIRYEPEAGGDAWASQRTMSYLNGNAYRFNDISPVHVAQHANGRSILNHGGHSDGSQIDFRYADGQGGFSDAMGGADHGRHIENVFNLARKEADDGSNLARKHVQAAVDWIRSNRQLLKQEAANARILYAGDTWMMLALRYGQFPDGTPIVLRGEEIGPWIDMPKNISFQPSHLNHWHISLNHGDARGARKDLEGKRSGRAR